MDHEQNVTSLTRLFASLILTRHNINVLHWGAKGKGFDNAHNTMEEYGDTLNGFIDEVAEIMLMCNHCIPTFIDCANIVNADSVKHHLLHTCPGGMFGHEKVCELSNCMLGMLMDKYTEAENMGLPADVVSKLQEHHYWLRKEVCYKGRQKCDNDCYKEDND